MESARKLKPSTQAVKNTSSMPVKNLEPMKEAGSYVIAIASQKGGVAKTTTVVSLGGALVQRDKEVLLVDLDSQSNLTLALGKDPGRVRGAITDVLFNSATMLSVSRETAIPGLDLIPSNSGMDLAERFLSVRKDYETILRRAISSEILSSKNLFTESRIRETRIPKPFIEVEDDQYRRQTSPTPNGKEHLAGKEHLLYDFVILDCPPFIGAVTLNALVASTLLIIPTQPEFFSAYALRTMMGIIQQVRSQYNPDLIYRILITMFDRRNRIHREVGEQIRTTFGQGVFETIIEVDTKLRESAVEGLPITHHKSQSRSAVQYDALAQEIMQYVRSR